MEATQVLDAFKNYVDEQKERYFNGMEILEILEERHKGHRTERFVDTYLLRSKEDFWTLHDKATELSLGPNFDRTVQALFREKNKSKLCAELCALFIREYGITKKLLGIERPNLSVLQTIKGLDSFVAYMLRTNREVTATKEVLKV
jgi:hypothetical protein